ncbi:Hydroxypyruvate isomerase [compost metagenome]
MEGMFTFSANLSTLFTELPFADRFAAARACGFEAVECQFPYGHTPDHLAALLRANGLRMVLHNLPGGDAAAGDRGMACHPQRVGEFRAGVARGLTHALALGVPQLNCLAGLQPPGVSEAQARATLVGNLRFAAAALRVHGLRLLMEPLNTRDVPGFFVSRTAQALAIMDEVGADNLYLQHDLYHAQRMQGELAGTLRALLPRIGHIQIADNPGRGEPGSGEINHRFLFDELDRLGYSGHVGCEYFPLEKRDDGTRAGLTWLAAHGRHPSGRTL